MPGYRTNSPRRIRGLYWAGGNGKAGRDVDAGDAPLVGRHGAFPGHTGARWPAAGRARPSCRPARSSRPRGAPGWALHVGGATARVCHLRQDFRLRAYIGKNAFLWRRITRNATRQPRGTVVYICVLDYEIPRHFRGTQKAKGTNKAQIACVQVLCFQWECR